MNAPLRFLITGATGFIHNVLREQYLNQHPAPEDIEYYMCVEYSHLHFWDSQSGK